MICASCKKEIDISYGQAFFNGCYCENCARKFKKPRTNFDRITENEEALAEYISSLARKCTFRDCSKEECAKFECKDCIKEWLQKECEE